MVLTLPHVGQVLSWVGGNIDIRVFTEGATDDIDLSAYLLGINTSGGAERWGQRFKVGTCDLVFDNTSGIFSSDAQVTKPFTKLFRPSRKIWVVTIPNPDAPTDFKPFFAGIIDSIDEDYDGGGYDNTVAVRCLDNGGIWQGFNPLMLVTPTGVEYSHERVASALDRMTWDAGLRDIETGFHRLQSSFLAQTTWEEMQTAADAEGGAFFAGPDGTAVFKNRDWLTTEQDPVVIDSFVTTGLVPRGLTFDGTYLWRVTEAGGVYTLRSFTTEGVEVDAFTAAAAYRDLTFDGTYLYGVYDFGVAGRLDRIDPSDGSVLATWTVNEANNPVGLASDLDGGFWILSVDSSLADGWVLLRYQPSTNTITDWFVGPGSIPTTLLEGGLAFDGTDLWVVHADDDTIYRVSPSGGPSSFSFAAPSTDTRGIAWSGLHLWTIDQSTRTVYRVERYRPTTVQGYIGYSDVPVGAQVGHMTDVRTNFEIARVKNQVRFARVGSTMQEANDLLSQAEYGLRSYERTDYKNSIDNDVLFLSERYLTKHSLPRLRVEGVTYSGTFDPLNQDRNRLLWDIRYGDLLKVKVPSGEGWSFERLVNVLGITHRITANDWTVTLRLDDSLSNFVLNRELLVSSLDPIAWWSFDVDGTADRTGLGHTLTWNSAPTWAVTGGPVPDLSASGVPVAGADGMVTLDGVDDWATVASEADLELFEDYSIEAWVNFDSVSGMDRILSCAKSTGTSGELGTLQIYQLDRLNDHFALSVGSPSVLTSLSTLVAATWYHVVGTVEWTATGQKVSLYVNGEKDAEDHEFLTQPTAMARAVYVGKTLIDSDGGSIFDGKISELVVYRGALTETQVSNLYRSAY